MLRFRDRVLRFRDLGASFSSFGCFVLRSSFSSASFSKLPPFFVTGKVLTDDYNKFFLTISTIYIILSNNYFF